MEDAFYKKQDVRGKPVCTEYQTSDFPGKKKTARCLSAGEVETDLEFSDDGPSLQELFCSFLIRKKTGM